MQALDAGARGMGTKGQSANGLDSLSTSGAFSKPQSLTAALQDLNLQSASLDGVPAGGQKFGVVRSSGHSSMDNEVGSSAGEKPLAYSRASRACHIFKRNCRLSDIEQWAKGWDTAGCIYSSRLRSQLMARPMSGSKMNTLLI